MPRPKSDATRARRRYNALGIVCLAASVAIIIGIAVVTILIGVHHG